MHRMTAQWKSPDGASSTTSPVQYEAKDRRFGAYWSLSLSPALAAGTWSIEATVDGPGWRRATGPQDLSRHIGSIERAIETARSASKQPRVLGVDDSAGRGIDRVDLRTGFRMRSVDGAYQALGGGLCAVAAHCRGDGLGTGSHLGLEGVLESARQRVGRWCAGYVSGSDAEVVYSLCPVVLVVDLGDDDRLGRHAQADLLTERPQLRRQRHQRLDIAPRPDCRQQHAHETSPCRRSAQKNT
jgi:hypothetical protein